MAVTGQSTGYHHTVGAILESAQDVQNINPSAAEDLDDLDRRWVLNPLSTSFAGVVVGAMGATEGHNLGLEVRPHSPQFSINKASSLTKIWSS